MDKGNQTDDAELRAIRSMFEHGDIRRMFDIHTLSPTRISKALGINHGRYIEKLSKPEKFTLKEVRSLSSIIGVKPELICTIIFKEIL